MDIYVLTIRLDEDYWSHVQEFSGVLGVYSSIETANDAYNRASTLNEIQNHNHSLKLERLVIDRGYWSEKDNQIVFSS